jgi:hypothetical protein
MNYDYLFLTLKRVPQPHPALSAHLTEVATPLAVEGGGVVGQFAPQLGWANNEAAVLVRWQADAVSTELITRADLVAGARIERLTPTIRPADDAMPKAGGIYVHRWFEVDAGAVDEFVDLSGRGWATFETTFDALIFGLFRAEQTEADRAARAVRLLLLTRYGTHGVWEDSRDPTTEAMQIFMRRQQLTKRSWAASTRLV